MQRFSVTSLLLTFSLAGAASIAACADVKDRDEASSEDNAAAITASIEQARQDPVAPFQLTVNCTDQKGIRALELFASGAAIWNRKSQIRVPDSIRSALLGSLLEAGFAGFARQYGGQKKADKAEAAPLKVTCRIALQLDDLEKSSVQAAYGEQNAALLSLAATLLDQVEDLSANGVAAKNLQDGIAKLSKAELAPEALRVRMLRLPAESSKSGGFILRAESGRLSRQAYSPGESVASPVWSQFEPEQFDSMIKAINSANFDTLPINLPGSGHVEIEIQVLQHRKTVTSRPYSRIEKGALAQEQRRFNQLAASLGELTSETVKPTDN
jgi:hypothetical protein